MITTGCEGCCFLKRCNEGKWCTLNQMGVLKNGKPFAPGYCRLCRSYKWANKQGTEKLDELQLKVIEECTLKFDMLVIFDESKNRIEDLERTLNSEWYTKYAQKIIIADVTGFGKRQNLALQYIKSKQYPIPIVVDSSVSKEPFSQLESTIKRLSIKITAPFFLVIPAGKILENFNIFAKMIQYISSRVIHWSFPLTVGPTAIVPNNLHYGLFITKPYRTLIKSSENGSFFKQFKKEEIETEMALSWFCENCWMV